MGEDPEVTRFRSIMGVFVFWVLSGVMSCDELAYARKGETVTAQRVSSNSLRQTHATYRWQDSKTGKQRKKVFETRGQPLPAHLEIQYIPGRHDSRPASAGSWLMPSIFLGLTALGVGIMAYFGIKDKRR